MAASLTASRLHKLHGITPTEAAVVLASTSEPDTGRKEEKKKKEKKERKGNNITVIVSAIKTLLRIYALPFHLAFNIPAVFLRAFLSNVSGTVTEQWCFKSKCVGKVEDCDAHVVDKHSRPVIVRSKRTATTCSKWAARAVWPNAEQCVTLLPFNRYPLTAPPPFQVYAASQLQRHQCCCGHEVAA